METGPPGSWEGVRPPHLPGRGGKWGGMQSWGHQGGCTTTLWGIQGLGEGSHTQRGPTGGAQGGWLCERQQQRQSQCVKALPGWCTAAGVGRANPACCLSLHPRQVSSSCREFSAALLASTLQGSLCFSPNTELVSQCRAVPALAQEAVLIPHPPQGTFTLQIISSTSREVSPGRMTVRAGWLLGRQNHEGVKYSWTQISQSGLCWWTLLRATSFSL